MSQVQQTLNQLQESKYLNRLFLLFRTVTTMRSGSEGFTVAHQNVPCVYWVLFLSAIIAEFGT